MDERISLVDEQLDGIDFAVAAYLEGGDWTVRELALTALIDVETLAAALQRLPGDHGAVGMVAVDEDFFVLVRVGGPRTRVLLSDVTAAEDWALAESALDFLGLDAVATSDEEDDPEPVGDLGLLEDLGLSETELEDLLDEEDLYPDEVLSDIAQILGFGELFDDAVGLTPA